MLDSAERGETILLTRGGDPVATIAPALHTNGVHPTEVTIWTVSTVTWPGVVIAGLPDPRRWPPS